MPAYEAIMTEQDGVLGIERSLFWDPLAAHSRFMAMTYQQTLLMDLEGWHAIPALSRPLPERTQIIVIPASQEIWFPPAVIETGTIHTVTKKFPDSCTTAYVLGSEKFRNSLESRITAIHVFHAGTPDAARAFRQKHPHWTLEDSTQFNNHSYAKYLLNKQPSSSE